MENILTDPTAAAKPVGKFGFLVEAKALVCQYLGDIRVFSLMDVDEV
jgi:hypothetical protein